MPRSRRRHGAELKFKVALEPAKGPKTLNEIASEFSLHPNLVSQWKQPLLDGRFCLEALHTALAQGRPEIFNTDQGGQFTANEFTQTLEHAGICISMDGRGRALDNIFVERLWRTVKYENVYLMDASRATVPDLLAGLKAYFQFYNGERLHQSLGYRTPKPAEIIITTRRAILQCRHFRFALVLVGGARAYYAE